MSRYLYVLLCFAFINEGCKSKRFSGDYYCSYEPEIPISKISDYVVSQADSIATLTIEMKEGAPFEEEDLTIGRLSQVDADTSYYQRMTDGKLTFQQSPGFYLFELRLFHDRIYRDSFQLNAFEHRKLIIDPGKPLSFVTYQGKEKNQKK